MKTMNCLNINLKHFKGFKAENALNNSGIGSIINVRFRTLLAAGGHFVKARKLNNLLYRLNSIDFGVGTLVGKCEV